MALPMRMSSAYAKKPAPHLHCCGSRQRCEACEVFIMWGPPVRAHAVMQACREARHETMKLSRQLCTWLVEGDLDCRLYAAWERQDALENILYGEEMVPMIIPFNKKRDCIVITSTCIRCFLQLPGPPNHDDLFQVALDPEVTLLLHSSLFHDWLHPADAFATMRNGIQALYHRYLRPRKHLFIVVNAMPPYVLTEEGWQKAIHEGLFSGHREEVRHIPVADEALIRKYEALLHHCHQHINPSWRFRVNMDEMLWSGRPHTWHGRQLAQFKNLNDASYSQWILSRLFSSRDKVSIAVVFMLQIADFIMWDMGLGYGRGEEIMDLDGHLKKNHPLVQQYDLRLPDFTPVVTFEALKPPVSDRSIRCN